MHCRSAGHNSNPELSAFAGLAVTPLQELRDEGGRRRGGARLDRAVGGLAAECAPNRIGKCLRARVLVVEPGRGAVAVEPVADVEALLEVARERDRYERA